MSLFQPVYDRRAPKLTLHVGGISEEAKEKFLEMKFGVFGSIGEVNFLRSKNIGKCNLSIQIFINRDTNPIIAPDA